MKAESIVDIAKRRGFFWQSSGIYGGLAGFYDYAHLGTSMKRRWENIWRNYFLGLDDNFHEIQPCLIMHEKVFSASGHLESFIDPVVRCMKCLHVERADHLLEDNLSGNFEGLSVDRMTEMIRKHNIRCPRCGGELEDVGVINMMFPVDIGTGNPLRAYLSPETAQGAYVNFKQEFEALRRKLPLGLAIIGRAFRNEISPRNVLIRMREFTQAELQIFFDPETINEHPRFSEVSDYKLVLFPAKGRKSGKVTEMKCREVVGKYGLPEFYVYYMARVQQFYLDVLGFSRKVFRFRELTEEEKAFYNKYHWDVELHLESLGGFREVAGVHYRTDHDLKGHQRVSGINMTVNINGREFIPHVLELSFGVDRNIYALFELCYREEKERTLFRFPGRVSPFDAGVFPLVNRDGLPEKSREVYSFLKKSGFDVFYDSGGSIGRRYRRIDEIGVAAGITIDYQTLQDSTVTLRDRDSMKQIRVGIAELPTVLRRFLDGERIENLGRVIN
ncbi:MAG TPA: glycine--tRNA ligase [Candidatus Aenigmarchaeota archaeon]|nr:glycine--tRNA ligase [Candidatus Aenigmarchaeota archaeon]